MAMSKVLVVGGSTFMSYHMSNHLNDSFDITATYTTEDDGWNISRPWASRVAVLDPPWTRVVIDMNSQVLKACFSGLLSFGGYDWVILSPEVLSDERSMVASCLVDALQTTLYPGSVVMLPHESANESASSDGNKLLAELFTIETNLLWTTCLKRVYILRIAMLQEQLLFALPRSTKSLVLPVDLHFLNQVATSDLVRSVRALLAHTSSSFAQRTRCTSLLTGPSTCVRHTHLDIIIHGLPSQFCLDPDGSQRKRYLSWSRRVQNSTILPDWPANGEIALVREYLGYVGRSPTPAKPSSDWSEICPGEEMQPLSVLFDVIHDHLSLL
ncbi:hypothetical protein BG006_009387 [Podila minutissima]|uniref:Uncharacterized protein n=1 Tax=Podila minutissima TaxID=64525 RepID=A0A9P5VJ97_9FUNG|nr:hypothetical protein BG006_009387 [Podila minutissima]